MGSMIGQVLGAKKMPEKNFSGKDSNWNKLDQWIEFSRGSIHKAESFPRLKPVKRPRARDLRILKIAMVVGRFEQ